MSLITTAASLSTMPKTLYFLSLVALFCLVIQYHVSNTRSVSSLSSTGGQSVADASKFDANSRRNNRSSANDCAVFKNNRCVHRLTVKSSLGRNNSKSIDAVNTRPIVANIVDNDKDEDAEVVARRIASNIHLDLDVVKTAGDLLPIKVLTFQIAMEILTNPNYSLQLAKRQSRQKPTIYVITPTYKRPEQIAELTRLSQTLMHVDNMQWLVIEDADVKSPGVEKLLNKINMKVHHLIAPMPEVYRRKNGPKPKGVSNRNEGIKWIRANAEDGVMYFADDDNTYDLELFNEMRYTEKVAMWPVGLCSSTQLSTPVVQNGKVVSFYDGWFAGRKFPVDMAGFAVNVKFLRQRSEAIMPYVPGYEEDGFLKSLAPFEPSEIEPKADDCTKILVWHTQTKKSESAPEIDLEKYPNSNLVKLKQTLL